MCLKFIDAARGWLGKQRQERFAHVESNRDTCQRLKADATARLQSFHDVETHTRLLRQLVLRQSEGEAPDPGPSADGFEEALWCVNKNSGYIVSLITSNSDYTAYVRMRLDVSQLPKPLQVNALTTDEWKMDSEGYSWKLVPEEIAKARKGEQ